MRHAPTTRWFLILPLLTGMGAGCGEDDEGPECAKGLCVSTADKALATSFNRTFDWTADKAAVAYVAAPGRAQLERGIYVNNPALYQDPGGESTVTPATALAISNAASFDFQLSGGATSGAQALDPANIFDTVAATPLTAAEQADAFVWAPAIEGYLFDWDSDVAGPLFYLGLAVRGQDWGGGSTIAAQAIEVGYLHGTEMWVKIVFQPFVAVDASITDSDGDGWPEIWAKLADVHVASAAITKLRDDYVTPRYDAAGLQGILAVILEDLYTATNPTLLAELGESFTLAGVGTFEYPFAVIGHGTPGTGAYVEQVLLVEP